MEPSDLGSDVTLPGHSELWMWPEPHSSCVRRLSETSPQRWRWDLCTVSWFLGRQHHDFCKNFCKTFARTGLQAPSGGLSEAQRGRTWTLKVTKILSDMTTEHLQSCLGKLQFAVSTPPPHLFSWQWDELPVTNNDSLSIPKISERSPDHKIVS